MKINGQKARITRRNEGVVGNSDVMSVDNVGNAREQAAAAHGRCAGIAHTLTHSAETHTCTYNYYV